MSKMEVPTVTQDLYNMLGDTRFCDMRFICSDGQEVPALRMLVAARSPVLQSMLLTSGMAESRLERVPLADTRGSVMRACMEFLYTDSVKPGSWPKPLDEAMEVAAAARFFLIPGLETSCVTHLSVVITNIEAPSVPLAGKIKAPSVPLAGEIIRAYSLGAELYHDQPHEKLGILLNALAKRVQSALNQSLDGYKVLSERGCLRLLGDAEFSDAFSVKEYHLLLLAIKWCTSRVLLADSSLEEDTLLQVLDKFFPSSNACLCSMLEEGCHVTANASELRFFKMLADPLASFLDKASLDLSKVPPTILCTVFEPLPIIPCSKLLAAYRVQALCPMSNVRWDNLYLHENYAVSELDPTEISCTWTSYGFEGFVASSMCVRASDCLISEWEIVMLAELCNNFRYGFYFGERTLIATSSKAICLPGKHVRSVALGFNDIVYQSDGFQSFFLDKKPRMYAPKGTRLGVHIDFLKGWCTFKVDGVIKASQPIEAWKDGGGVYPAISMAKPGKGRLEMVLPKSVLKKDVLMMASLDPDERDPKKCRHA